MLLHSGLMMDGDECVVGLMAKHTMHFNDVSLFFWGQNYGLTIIEVLFIIPFYLVLGINTIAVKTGMLVLWSIGVVFLYKTMLRINNSNKLLALILTSVLILCPAWIYWAMKARGGYISAFALSSVTLYILFSNKQFRLKYLLIGVITYLIYEAQPFWIAGVLPLVAYRLFQNKKQAMPFIAGLVAMGIIFFLLKQNISSIYSPPLSSFSFEALANGIKRFPEYLFLSLQGNYFFAWYQDTNGYYRIFSVVFTTITFIIAIAGVVSIFTKKKKSTLFFASTFFIYIIAAMSSLSPEMQGRYLLPVTSFSLLSIYIYAAQSKRNTPVYIVSLILLILAPLATVLHHVRFQERYNRQAMSQTIQFLKEHDVQHVYATNTMLPWEIQFYSDEQILGRMFYFPGRYPQYDTAVDKALYSGKKVAVFGYWKDYAGLNIDSPDLEAQYFIKLNPSKKMLETAFDFPLAQD